MRVPTQPRLRGPGLALLLLVLLTSAAFAQVEVPPLRSRVTDLTQTLTAEQRAALESRLQQFEERKGSQIAVLLVPTTQPETIEQYSIRVAEQWKLGRKGTDDGALLLVAKNDRAVRIEVGYGLEGALPDVIANRIVNQVIVPRFRSGNFAGGIEEGVSRIMAVIEGEPLPEAQPASRVRVPEGIGPVLPLLLMLVFVGSGILRRTFGGLGGSVLTGAGAGLLVWLLTSFLVISIGAAAIAFLFTLFSSIGPSRGWTNPRRGGRSGGWGGWGGGGGGFGGGGGWSGGGGGFGGGGASGRW